MSEKVLNKVNSDIFSYDTTTSAFKMTRVMPSEIHHSSEGAGQNGYILTSTGDGWTWTNPSNLGIGGGGSAAVPSNLSNLILNQDGNPDFAANTGNNLGINVPGGVNFVNSLRSSYNGKYIYYISPWDTQYFLQYREYDSTTNSFASPVNFNSEVIEQFIVNKSNTILLTGSFYNAGGGGGGPWPAVDKLTKCYYNPSGEEGQDWTLLGSYPERITTRSGKPGHPLAGNPLYQYQRHAYQLSSFDNDNYEIYIGNERPFSYVNIIKLIYNEPSSITVYKKNLPFAPLASFMSDNYLVCIVSEWEHGDHSGDMEIWTKKTNPDDIQSDISEYDTLADGWYKYNDVNRDLLGGMRRFNVSKTGNYFAVSSFSDTEGSDQSNWIRTGNRVTSHTQIFKKKDDAPSDTCGYEKWTSIPHGSFGTLEIEETDTQVIVSMHAYVGSTGGKIAFINKSDKTLVTNGTIGTTTESTSGDDDFGSALNLSYFYHRRGGWPTDLHFYKLNMIEGSGQSGSQTSSNLYPSDDKIKWNETPIEKQRALEIIKEISFTKYDILEKPTLGIPEEYDASKCVLNFGVIAQEIKELSKKFPELKDTTKQGDEFMAVNYNNIFSLMGATIQNLIQRIEILEAKN